MTGTLKDIAKRSLPRPVIERAKRLKVARSIRQAQAALSKAVVDRSNDWLEDDEFPKLGREFPIRRTVTTPGRVEQRNDAVGRAVSARLEESERVVLEVGGGLGDTAWVLAEQGRSMTSLDLRQEICQGARQAGVEGILGDALDLPFDDNAFDAAYSIDAFEHIPDPGKALAEMIRVVRPGGTVHLSFGPLYNSPWGLHAYREIGVPHCQHLWSKSQFSRHICNPDSWGLNYLSIGAYRKAFAVSDRDVALTEYREEGEYVGLDLICRHASCFAKTSRDLSDFTVSKIVLTGTVHGH
ncbi:MAG: class I SAM-dependent methyltransferase [Planctomycetota bacterium]